MEDLQLSISLKRSIVDFHKPETSTWFKRNKSHRPMSQLHTVTTWGISVLDRLYNNHRHNSKEQLWSDITVHRKWACHDNYHFGVSIYFLLFFCTMMRFELKKVEYIASIAHD
ncbi:hypothetical protein NQD34_008797 [Periophthalmus magnuspinnatus]|nr:hypothetical protein NQD34_008797 [Periophthalmus magnuspinnatus]